MLHLGIVVNPYASPAVELAATIIKEVPGAVEVGRTQHRADVKITSDVRHQDREAVGPFVQSMLNFFVGKFLKFVDDVTSPLSVRTVRIVWHKKDCILPRRYFAPAQQSD